MILQFEWEIKFRNVGHNFVEYRNYDVLCWLQIFLFQYIKDTLDWGLRAIYLSSIIPVVRKYCDKLLQLKVYGREQCSRFWYLKLWNLDTASKHFEAF